MAQKTDAQLTTQKNEIKNETVANANSATRIGQMHEDVIDSKINNDKIDTANTLDTASKTVPGRDAVKAYIADAIAAINPLFLGLYTSLAALESAHATADSGQYAIVDPGSGTDAVKYIWDEDEGWVAGSSGPGSNLWADLVGDPSDNTAFNTYMSDFQTGINADLATKADSLISPQSHAGNYTLLAGDLALVLAGDVLKYIGDDSGDLTVPLNATVAFPVGTSLALIGYDNVVATGGVTITGTRGDLTIPTGTTAVLEKTATNTWTLHNGSPSTSASETEAGVVELATTAETVTGTDTARATTPAGVKAAIDALIAAAPGALNTLDELAAALGDDANFATTVTNALALKAPLASPTLTGTPTAPTAAGGTNTTQIATTAFVTTAVSTKETILDRASSSTAGATITLDMNSLRQRMFVGSASFSTPKTLAMSNATNALSFNFSFTVTDVNAELTMPADFVMSDINFDGSIWTPPSTGNFLMGGSYDGTNWLVMIAGPFA